MGITGLLPFLEKSSRRANIKEYAGQTVAIDAYCWLHKGAFSCAEKIVQKEPTTMYVTYCMKFVNMLLSHNIKPILVFDGKYLPAKAMTEKKRREAREINRKKGAELLRAGRVEEGRTYLRRSVDITHELALNLIKECRRRNVDCIVAPYEADAQLAFFSIKNIAQVIITEDSDLLLFGCERVMFKMDFNGNGILIEKSKLHIAMGVRPDNFTIDKFRYMCILSGCDYLASLPGIGLNKACKFVNRTSEVDIYEALRKLAVNLNMRSLVVTDEYRKQFMEADKTFRHQLVYDPVDRQQVPLTEASDKSDIVGEILDSEKAFQLAIGNYDPMSLKKLDNYDPDAEKPNPTRIDKALLAPHSSIWKSNYVSKVPKPAKATNVIRISTAGVNVTTGFFIPKKRPSQTLYDDSTTEDLLELYGKLSKRPCNPDCSDQPESSVPVPRSPPKSPILNKKNPFAVKRKIKTSQKLPVRGLAQFTLSAEKDKLLVSRYFSSDQSNQSALEMLDESESLINLNSSFNCTQETLLNCSDENLSVETNSCRSVNLSNANISDNESDILNLYTVQKSSASKISALDSSLESETEHIKSSQEENCSYISNLNILNDTPSVNQSSNVPRGCDLQTRKCTSTKAFYETPGEREIDTVGQPTSIYFSNEKQKQSLFKTRSPPFKSTPRKLMKPLRTGLSRPKEKKQQTLLSNFGFKARPKINEVKNPEL